MRQSDMRRDHNARISFEIRTVALLRWQGKIHNMLLALPGRYPSVFLPAKRRELIRLRLTSTDDGSIPTAALGVEEGGGASPVLLVVSTGRTIGRKPGEAGE